MGLLPKNSYFISSGEPSGDLLGGPLVNSLKSKLPGFTPYGVVGEKMKQEGVIPLQFIENLSVMGFAEVISHIPVIKEIESILLEQIDRIQPKFAILIDYPGLHLRLAEQLKARKIPVFQYVAPQLWAWGKNRTKKIKRVTDQVLGIMPFEENFFRERGVNYRYVGTPQKDRTKKISSFNFTDFPNLNLSDLPLYGFFPGSRQSELQKILPRISNIIQYIKKKSDLNWFAISLAPSIPLEKAYSLFKEHILNLDLDTFKTTLKNKSSYLVDTDRKLIIVRGNSLELMKRVKVALVTSGTATLECALLNTPMAVIYITSPLTYAIGKRIVKLENISLVNLVAERKIVKEFIQEFSTESISEHLIELSEEETIRNNLKEELKNLSSKLKGNLAENASDSIIAYLHSISKINK